MLRVASIAAVLVALPFTPAFAGGMTLADQGPGPVVIQSDVPTAYAPARKKRRFGGGFLEYVINGGETVDGPRVRRPAYVVNMGQPGYNGRGDLPYGYVAPEPRRKAASPAYVVNMGQPGYNGRGDLPYGYTAPVPARKDGAAAYVVNMGQPGYNGRGDLPDEYFQPGPPRRRTQLAWGGDYADPVYASPSYVAPDAAPAAYDRRLERQLVDYDGPQKAGTIVINTGERYLYLVQGNGKALRYGVGVGREGFEWTGTRKIERKAEWPDWRPPAEMLKRRPDLPDFMPGGPRNPLGARAMYLGGTLYRIHGSNEPQSIGHAVSSGCIRMRNQDVIDLYGRVGVGTTVVVM